MDRRLAETGYQDRSKTEFAALRQLCLHAGIAAEPATDLGLLIDAEAWPGSESHLRRQAQNWGPHYLRGFSDEQAITVNTTAAGGHVQCLPNGHKR